MVEEQQQVSNELSEEELIKIAQSIKDNTATQEDKQNLYSFLINVIASDETTKMGNLRDDKDYNELGYPAYNVRGALEMARISDMIMDNDFFKEFFQKSAEETLASSLSREGFLVRQGTVQTKQVADITRRKKTNKGWFGKKTEEESGGAVV